MMSAKVGQETANEDVWIRTVCNMCFNYCPIRVHRVNGVVVKVEGEPDHPHSLGNVCAKGNSGIMNLYDPYRVLKPLKRTNPEKGVGVDPKWVEISWEEALDTIVERLRKIRQEDPRKLILSSFDVFVIEELGYWASAFGTPNILGGAAGYFCGNGLHQVTYLTTGTFYTESDLRYCNYVLSIGSQQGFGINHTANRMTEEMADARMRGMKVVVVDPVCSTAASKSDEWIPIRPGTDAALALAMLNILLNELGIYDSEFLKAKTNAPYLIKRDGYYLRDKESAKPLVWDSSDNQAKPFDSEGVREPALGGSYEVSGEEVRPCFEALKEHVKRYSPEMAEGITTIPAATIRRLAKEFGEAAMVGAKIVIDGVELPFRPVSANFSRGVAAHKHAMLSSMAIQLLNIVVGAINVPGGAMGSNTVGPFWAPEESSDGLLKATERRGLNPLRSPAPYPAEPVERPKTLKLKQLVPVGPSGSPFLVINLLEPEKYGVPFVPEALISCRANILMTCTNPEEMTVALRKIPFIVSIARDLNETAEFADIVLPDSHYLERSDPFTNSVTKVMASGLGEWYWLIGQPAVKPPSGIRHWMEILFEIAERLDFARDLYTIMNMTLKLKDPFKLDPNQKYTWDEIGDHLLQSYFGPEHNLAWFRKNGSIRLPKKVQDAYPMPFLKPRIPIYLEYFLGAGEDVKRVTGEMGLQWDTSDYQPLPDWKPCHTHESGPSEYDLIAVNYKLPFHTFSITTNNAWLDDLSTHHPYAYKILINTETAKKKGVKDGSHVWIESERGLKVKGTVKITECVHPEVLGIAGTFGHWSKGMPVAKDKGVYFNNLLPGTLDRMDMVSCAVDACVRVKVFQ